MAVVEEEQIRDSIIVTHSTPIDHFTLITMIIGLTIIISTNNLK